MKQSTILKSKIDQLKCVDWSNEVECDKYKAEYKVLWAEYAKVRNQELAENRQKAMDKAAHIGISVVKPASRERNDCVVVAYSLVKNIPYEQSHSIFKALGRKNNCGVYNTEKHLPSLGLQLVDCSSNTMPVPYDVDYNDKWAYQVKTYLNQGKYLVCVPGHVFSIIDGVIYDSKPGLRRCICEVWKA